MHQKDLNIIVGVMSLLGSVLIFVVSRVYPERAAMMPMLISGILGFSALVLLVKAVRRKEKGPPMFKDVSWRSLIVTILLWFLLILVSKWVNFFICAVLFLFTVALALGGRPKNSFECGRVIVFSTLFPILCWIVFSLFLNVDFPVEGLIDV